MRLAQPDTPTRNHTRKILGKYQEILEDTGKYQENIRKIDGRRKLSGKVSLAVGPDTPTRNRTREKPGRVLGNTGRY